MTDIPSKISLPPITLANDLINEPDPDYDWIIPEVLEHGDRVIFTGKEGMGKSTLLRQIAVQAASGVHPFTLAPIDPIRVLLIDAENPKPHIRRKLREMGEQLPPLAVASWPGGLNLSDDDYRDAAEASLSEAYKMLDGPPDLIVGGPLYKMAQNLEKEEVSAVVASTFDKWRAKLHCALILEAHQPHEVTTMQMRFRPERPVGSSLWMRWPEFGICLENDGTLRHWRGARDIRAWPDKLRHGDSWPWVVDDRTCMQCSEPLTGKQERYCSEKCRNAGKQRTFRARHGFQYPVTMGVTPDSA